MALVAATQAAPDFLNHPLIKNQLRMFFPNGLRSPAPSLLADELTTPSLRADEKRVSVSEKCSRS